jgi:hypothetical protein
VRIDVPVAAPMVPIRLCYAGHACRLQGAEAPVVLVVPGDGTTSLESAYSSLSRGQEEIHVFADTTTHGPDPLAHLAERWAHPEPKRSATARARELAEQRVSGSGPDPYGDLRPDDQERCLSGPMTRRQQSYLAHLLGEEPPRDLTKAEASTWITELQERSGRDVPEWAQQAAAELAELPTIEPSERSPAPPPAAPERKAEVERRHPDQAKTSEPQLPQSLLSPPTFDPDRGRGIERETEVARRHRPDTDKELLPQSKLAPPTFDPDRGRGVELERQRALERSLRPRRRGPVGDG